METVLTIFDHIVVEERFVYSPKDDAALKNLPFYCVYKWRLTCIV